jgi:cobalt/nickel transport system permease protein
LYVVGIGRRIVIMHVPDGFLDVPTSIATGVMSAGVVVVALRRARRELNEAVVPMIGLVSAFAFAVQMLNFPVGVGTSGHLMGGALAAVLVGPWAAVLALTVVLTVQALVFADGGLTALGTNVLLIGIVTVAVGWFVARGIAAVLPRRPASAGPAAVVAALVSVPVASLVFVLLYAIGGATELNLARLTQFMVGWHVLIGIGEAAITGLVVGSVVATRPDLVYLVRDVRPTLVVTGPDGEVREEEPAAAGADGGPGSGPGSGPGRRGILVALGATLLLAGAVSSVASASPDGLEYVTEELGLMTEAEDSVVADSPLGDYGIPWIDDSWLSTGVAGVVGVGLTLAGTLLLARVALPRRAAPPSVPARGDARV